MARRIVATYSERHLALLIHLARVVVVVVVFSFCCRFSLIHRRRERDLQSRDAFEMVDVVPVESVATLVPQGRHVEERNRVQVLRLEGRQELGEGAGPFLFVRSDRIEAVESETLERVRLDLLQRNKAARMLKSATHRRAVTGVTSENAHLVPRCVTDYVRQLGGQVCPPPARVRGELEHSRVLPETLCPAFEQALLEIDIWVHEPLDDIDLVVRSEL